MLVARERHNTKTSSPHAASFLPLQIDGASEPHVVLVGIGRAFRMPRLHASQVWAQAASWDCI